MENNKKILVIDDEVHIRNVIALKLEKRGYRVLMAANGEEGLDIIKNQRPNVVVSDIMMPKLDGKNLCKQTNDLKAEWPFLTIIMTCRIFPDEHNWINEMQDTMLLEKPFSPSKLMEQIDQYCKIQS